MSVVGHSALWRAALVMYVFALQRNSGRDSHERNATASDENLFKEGRLGALRGITETQLAAAFAQSFRTPQPRERV